MLDLDFIDGTKGAHVNISGISGVATKTSYATFLLYSLFNSGVLGAAATNTKGLIFNVKGEDLLFLDHANTRLDETQRARYGLLGLPAAPFRSVRVLAPPRRGDPNGTPATGARTTGVRPLYWTIAEFCTQGLLPFLFADAEDERQQYTIVVQAVTAQLRQEAASRRHPRRGGAHRRHDACARSATLSRVVESKLMPDDPDDDADPHWSGRAVGRGTISAFVRRLASAERHLEHLVRADLADAASHSIDLDAQQVTVVDLHMLHDRAKRFVVGVVLRQAFDAKEAAGTALPLQFVVLDELNKYAPRDSSSPIKEILLDVAERGPQPRDDPDRRPADGQRGRATGRRQLRRARRRPARLRRGRAGAVRVPARRAASAGDDPQTGLDVRVPAPTAGAAPPRVPVPGLGHPRRRSRPARRSRHRS